ncbi:hypothetical protein L1987_66145 [Smallanthus sonchifolius]|uniref:Uncharacterized protein n=1 Tax=Smallanthus sonchifolius TaxID=185202 RepID=A0ACB9BWK3_9ASTR|nr:hypothetical protein L1987_66145 [Smallanthus sonchifolius]
MIFRLKLIDRVVSYIVINQVKNKWGCNQTFRSEHRTCHIVLMVADLQYRILHLEVWQHNPYLMGNPTPARLKCVGNNPKDYDCKVSGGHTMGGWDSLLFLLNTSNRDFPSLLIIASGIG